MKKVIAGKTYNTETSTPIARCDRRSDDDLEIDDTRLAVLYQTRGGAFFLYEQVYRRFWRSLEPGKSSDDHMVTPMTRDEAHQWFMDGDDIEVVSDVFDEPPEATSEADDGATLVIRMPSSLKRDVEHAAKTAGQSANVWAQRCIEMRLSSDKESTSPAS